MYPVLILINIDLFKYIFLVRHTDKYIPRVYKKNYLECIFEYDHEIKNLFKVII